MKDVVRALKDMVDSMVLVSDDELYRAILTVPDTTGQLAEGAKLDPELANGGTVLILSGGNLPVSDLRCILAEQ
jgi:hypothetical protein